nr:hypothetical protein Iba_chr14fCG7520 [Ipomoea batatas]
MSTAATLPRRRVGVALAAAAGGELDHAVVVKDREMEHGSVTEESAPPAPAVTTAGTHHERLRRLTEKRERRDGGSFPSSLRFITAAALADAPPPFQAAAFVDGENRGEVHAAGARGLICPSTLDLKESDATLIPSDQSCIMIKPGISVFLPNPIRLGFLKPECFFMVKDIIKFRNPTCFQGFLSDPIGNMFEGMILIQSHLFPYELIVISIQPYYFEPNWAKVFTRRTPCLFNKEDRVVI